MTDAKIIELVSTLLAGVRSISKSETVMGEPQRAGDTTVIPVHRVRIAFGAATANAGARGARLGGDTGGQGAGGAVELEPVAAITVGKDGSTRLLSVDGEERASWSKLLEDVPDMLGRLARALGDRAGGDAGAGDPAVPTQEPKRSLGD